jgi:hypothetical protein
MTGSAEFNVWNPCDTVFAYVPVAERTVQPGYFFVMNMIEKNRLIYGYPTINWKDGIEYGFGLKSIAMVGNHEEKDEDDDKNKEDKSLFHIYYHYWIGPKAVKKKSAERIHINEINYPGSARPSPPEHKH